MTEDLGEVTGHQAGVVLQAPEYANFARLGYASVEQMCVGLIEACRKAPAFIDQGKVMKSLGDLGRYECIHTQPSVWRLIEQDVLKIGTGTLILIPDNDAGEVGP